MLVNQYRKMFWVFFSIKVSAAFIPKVKQSKHDLHKSKGSLIRVQNTMEPASKVIFLLGVVFVTGGSVGRWIRGRDRRL